MLRFNLLKNFLLRGLKDFPVPSDQRAELDIYEAAFPHCDQRVLHAPGACEHCDHYPHYQELRKAWGINFTGIALEHEANDPKSKLLPCPSDFNRGLGGAHVWGGNRPKPKEPTINKEAFFRP